MSETKPARLTKCDYCGAQLHSGRRRFCSNKHKDKYHNEHNPRGRYAHLANENSVYDDAHPFSTEALGQWDD